jgi:hypothetical protein
VPVQERADSESASDPTQFFICRAMGPAETTQHAIRRSTRLPLEVPVRVTSLAPECSFSEQCNTTLVNAHGCGLISPQPIAKGVQVRLEIVSAQRYTTARVAEVVPLGGEPETFLVGLELQIPGNFWGIEYAPSDWKVEEPAQPAPPRSESVEAPAAKPGAGRRWRLTDISVGACYLESAVPFPAGTPVLVSVRTLNLECLLDGVVQVSHPKVGMGVVFTPAPDLRERVAGLIKQLAGHREAPRIFVGKKEGQPAAAATLPKPERDPESPDALLDLLLEGSALTTEQFLSDLRAQRLGKRRDPRIEIALPVLLSGVDVSGRPLDQRVTTINISRRGALLEGIHGLLAPGSKISLTRGPSKEEFGVAWVVNDAAPAGARIGVAAMDPNSSFWDAVLTATSESGLESVSLRGASTTD